MIIELIDAKGINVAQKQIKNAFLACFWAYVGQPHGHIGWAIPMPFASMNSTNPRTAPWNFHKKILRIGDFEKWPFFESAILDFFQKKKFCFVFFSNEENLGFLMWYHFFSKFWWLPWFQAKNHSHQTFQPAEYHRCAHCVVSSKSRREEQQFSIRKIDIPSSSIPTMKEGSLFCSPLYTEAIPLSLFWLPW